MSTFDWEPSADVIARANVTSLMRSLSLADYPSLHRWSAQNRAAYWQSVIERLGIAFRKPFSRIVDDGDPTSPKWLIDARMNIVESCFQAPPDATAIITQDANGKFERHTYASLQRFAGRLACALRAHGIGAGDAVAILLPMTKARSIATYLGVIAAGATVVSIADSFAPDEIATRLRISGAKLVFTQPKMQWGGKSLPLYEKVVAAKGPRAILFVAEETPLREGDLRLEQFVGIDRAWSPVECAPADPINILFSSGTTDDPKAIPWDHTTPIKCGGDAHFHHDIHPGDVLCWPTSLGWMMGPWLVFAALLNRATIALYSDAPTGRGFGEFVQNAGVTMLGLVPSLVRAWRSSACMDGLDWSKIRAFSSTGECSNADDMRFLMHLAGANAPVIEYCGGTEIGGAYVTGTVVEPCVASTFTTPALGLGMVLLDDTGKPADKGEVYLKGPSIGLSTRLLNRDHRATYFADAPIDADGTPLRKHGDELERLPDGRYRVEGRSDDTMNLGGIKVGCVEIERVVNQLPEIHETAAVAMHPKGGGPSLLVVFAVLKAGVAGDSVALRGAMQKVIREKLNPLFRVEEVRVVASLPRTASNKVMRRELRALL